MTSTTIVTAEGIIGGWGSPPTDELPIRDIPDDINSFILARVDSIRQITGLAELIEAADGLRSDYSVWLKSVPKDHPTKAAVTNLIEDHLRTNARHTRDWTRQTALKRAYRRLREAAGIEKPNRDLTPA